MAPIRDYRALATLDRKNLHLFVAGPGQGEAVAIALPGAGWIIVDSCRAAKDENGTSFPLVSILKRFRGTNDPIDALILTHPHRDHSEGFADLVDKVKPARIGIAGPPAPGNHPLDDAEQWLASQPRATGLDIVKVGAVRGALAAVREWARTHPGSLLILHDTVSIPTPRSPAQVTAIAPDGPELTKLWAALTLNERFSSHANQASVALAVRFGGTTLVLGGDLPYTYAAKVVPTGWSRVSQTYPHLSEHQAMKVPHHGSGEALHDGWTGNAFRDRCWCVSPFNSSSLPRLAAGEGLDRMLSIEKSVRLTAIPAARHVQASHSAPQIALSQLGYRREQVRTGLRFIDDRGIDIKPGSAAGPDDCVWAFEFDDSATLVTSWRGSAALQVDRDPAPPPRGVIVRRRVHS